MGNRKSLDKKEILKGVPRKIKNSKNWNHIKKDLYELKDNSPFPFLITHEKITLDHEKVFTKTIDGFHAKRKTKPTIKL